MRVVGSELRVDQVWYGEQFLRASQIGNVGVHLTGVDRIAFQTVHLCTFDFTIPVRTLNQTDHQATAATGCQVDQVVDDVRAALLVGLNNKTDPVPACQFGLKAQFFQQIEGDLQSVGFFGININADVILTCQQGQRLQARIKLIHHAVILRTAVSWVQRRQFDGDPRAFINTASIRRFTNGMDRLLVGDHIGLGIGGGQRSLTQHVIGVAEAFLFQFTCVSQCFCNGFSGDELLTHQAHRHIDTFTHQRFATLTDDAVQ